MVETGKNTVKILLIEDTPGDVRLITEGFKRTSLEPQFHLVGDGEQALNILLNEESDQAHLPDLILLDINLPLISGHEVLKLIKNNGILKKIPVVILTSSLLDEDIAKAKANLADFYVIKPINLDEYFASILKIERFWRNFQDSKKGY
jgi:two-component system, chemotaxis family, response regulator Rcp1